MLGTCFMRTSRSYVLVVMYFVYAFTPYRIVLLYLYKKINAAFYFQKNLNMVRRCLLKLEFCEGI